MVAYARAIAVAVAATVVLLFLSGAVRAAPASTSAKSPIAPSGELDCNGHSSAQSPISSALQCIHPRGAAGVFEDNHHYVGHDEPELRFISDRAGTGNSMAYSLVLPDESTLGNGVPSYENYITFWLGLAMCDNNSYPQQTCINGSDVNTGLGQNASDAGSAVMELQFYPPGFPNFAQAVSCDSTHWCAALNIDSLECTFLFKYCNHNCEEPVNFAFLTMNGFPIGPPSPQKATLATFDVPANPNVLLMNPGDALKVVLQDTPSGLSTVIKDVTTGTTGSMVASSGNGFMHTSLRSCHGTPYSFHPEYSSASVNNIVPWTALQLGVGLAVEFGHFELQDEPLTHSGKGTGDDSYCLLSPNVVSVCLSTDFDFDGTSYTPGAWPSSLGATTANAAPVTLQNRIAHHLGPSSGGQGYSEFELQSIAGFTVNQVTGCNLLAPGNCGLPNATAIPTYAGFYPFYSAAGCTAVFGDVSGPGIQDFGGDAGYGTSVPVFSGTVAIFGGLGAFYTNTC